MSKLSGELVEGVKDIIGDLQGAFDKIGSIDMNGGKSKGSKGSKGTKKDKKKFGGTLEFSPILVSLIILGLRVISDSKLSESYMKRMKKVGGNTLDEKLMIEQMKEGGAGGIAMIDSIKAMLGGKKRKTGGAFANIDFSDPEIIEFSPADFTNSSDATGGKKSATGGKKTKKNSRVTKGGNNDMVSSEMVDNPEIDQFQQPEEQAGGKKKGKRTGGSFGYETFVNNIPELPTFKSACGGGRGGKKRGGNSLEAKDLMV